MGKKGKKVKKEIDVDGIDTSLKVKKELLEIALAMKDAIDREDEMMVQFKIEKAKILDNWEVDRQKEDDLKIKLLDTEKGNEDIKAKAAERTNNAVQKDKHVSLEMNEKLMNFKMECKKNRMKILEDYKKQEDQLAMEKAELERMLSDQKTEWGERLRNVALDHANEINDIKEDFERALQEYIFLSEANLEKTLKDYENKRNAMVQEAENRKQERCNEMLNRHKQELEELKMYYNNILSNNLSVTDTLKVEAEDQLVLSERCKHMANEAQNKYKNLCEKYNKTAEDIQRLTEESMNLEKYEAEYEIVNRRFQELEKGKFNLMWSNAMLEQVNDRVEQQVAKLKESVDHVDMDLEQRKAFKQTVKCWNKILNHTETLSNAEDKH